MEEIAAIVFQLLIEVGLQFFGGLGLDLAATRNTRNRSDADAPSGCSGPALFALFGAICGGLSLLVAPTLILPNLGLRLLNLALAPVLAGGLSYLVAANI